MKAHVTTKTEQSWELKIIRKSGKFSDNSNIFLKLIFALKFDILVWQDKKWEWLQNQQNHILQQKNVVAGKNLP